MNAASVLVFAVIVTGFILAVRYLYKSHKEALSGGKTGCACSGGCAGCSGGCNCAGMFLPPDGIRAKLPAGKE